jgi:hypothetical protein
MLSLDSEAQKTEKRLTVGFWSCDACGDGGPAPDTETATSRAITHAALHRAQMGVIVPVFMRQGRFAWRVG